MREIKFRGKNKCGDWVYGNLVKIPNEILIVASVPFAFKEKDPEHWKIMEYNGIKNSITVYCVLSKTVGQFTGLQDSKGIDIYEGDIIESVEDADHKFHYAVFFDNGAFRVKHQKFNDFGVFNVLNVVLKMTKCKVIGNIHDNPELLKGVD